MPVAQESLLTRFYDRVDGVVEGNVLDLLADDFQFELVSPDSRVIGDKEAFRQNEIRAGHLDAETGQPKPRPAAPRRHVLRTLNSADGVETWIGETHGGRVDGTVVAAAQANAEGKMRRFVVITSTVRFADSAPSADTR